MKKSVKILIVVVCVVVALFVIALTLSPLFGRFEEKPTPTIVSEDGSNSEKILPIGNKTIIHETNTTFGGGDTLDPGIIIDLPGGKYLVIDPSSGDRIVFDPSDGSYVISDPSSGFTLCSGTAVIDSSNGNYIIINSGRGGYVIIDPSGTISGFGTLMLDPHSKSFIIFRPDGSLIIIDPPGGRYTLTVSPGIPGVFVWNATIISGTDFSGISDFVKSIPGVKNAT